MENGNRLISIIFFVLLIGCATDLGFAAVLQDIGRASSSSDLNVKLSLNVTANVIIVSCHVSGIVGPIDDQKIQFYCPAIKSGSPCFYDCSPLCSIGIGQACELADAVLNSSVRCAMSKPTYGAKSIDLQIDIRQAKLAGNWYCRFQAKTSGDVAISREVLGRQPIVTEPPAAAVTTTSSAVAKTPQRPTLAPPDPELPPTRQPQPDSGQAGTDATTETGNRDDTTNYDARLIQFARADFVFGVPALLCASLIVNLAFCIRCCLAKYYVSLRRRKREPPGCLAHCLCVSTVQVVEKEPAANLRSGTPGEDTYEEVVPRMTRHQPQRSSVRTMETTYIDAPGMHRSRTLPPVGQTQASLYYLQGVSDSMSRILYDDVPAPSSRHSSRPSSPYGQLLSGRNSHSRSSLRGAGVKQQQQQQQVNLSANSIPAVPEESTPFVPAGHEDEEEEVGSDYSGATRLELSRMMLRKADTLLREANSLLRDTAHGGAVEAEGHGGQLHAAD